MERYPRLFLDAQELVRCNAADITWVLREASNQASDKTLFISCDTGRAIYNGATHIFNLSNPQLLNSLLQKHEVRFLILVDAITDHPSIKLLPPPDLIRPSEDWNIHLWEFYNDIFYSENKRKDDIARLRVLYYSVLFSRQAMFRVQYSNNSLVNMFGWLFCSKNRILRDLYLDMWLAYQE